MTIECGMSEGDEKKLFTLPIDDGQSENGCFQNRVDQSRIFHEFNGGQSECRNGQKRTTTNQKAGCAQIFHGDQ